VFTFWKAELVSATDYAPFGAPLASRTYQASEYRFAFNGKENDNEVEGLGNWQDYGERMYSPRLGRFPNPDPLTKEYPFYSPFQFSGNSPIDNVDLDGLEPLKSGYVTKDMREGKTKLNLPNTQKWPNTAKKVQTPATNPTETPKPAPKAEPAFVTRLYGSTYGELSGNDNPGNDRVASGGPDAAGVSLGLDGSIPGIMAGGARNWLESENGTSKYWTIKGGALNSINASISGGPSIDLYWKTDEGINTPTNKLLLGNSSFVSVGGGINVTYSWTENDKGKTTMRGFSVGLGVGLSAGKQYTFDSIGAPKNQEITPSPSN
jgi:RHS repeat-associated protein